MLCQDYKGSEQTESVRRDKVSWILRNPTDFVISTDYTVGLGFLKSPMVSPKLEFESNPVTRSRAIKGGKY